MSEVFFIESHRGGNLLVVENYLYRIQAKKSGKSYWKCASDRNHCKARAILNEDNNNELVKTTGFHNHNPATKEIEGKLFKNRLKERVIREGFLSVPKIYNEEVEAAATSASSEIASCLPSYKSIENTLYRARASVRPSLVQKSPHEEMEEWTKTKDLKNFLSTSTEDKQMMEEQNLDFATKAIHAGQDPAQWTHRAVIPPISMSTTFQQFAPAQHAGFEYARSGNPTRKCLEKCIAALECAEYGLCFASGLAATVSLTHLLKAGDHVVCFDDLYGGTNRYFRTLATSMGIEVSFIDMRDVDNVRKAIQKNTKMIWIETPTNPTMKLVDIQAVSDLLKEHPSIISVVDNTFMSSYFQKPLTLGAHVVMHSLTKYMNGHSDVVMGAIATNNQEIYQRMKYIQNSLGTVPSPFDCFLVNRGLKTLQVRMERHMENGLAVAKFLENHKSVEKVIYPGLKSHPQYELAQKQCTGSSGMVSFYIKGGLSEAQKFIKNLKVFTLAESLGSIESLVEIPSLMTHASVPVDQRKELGISDNLIRLSVGIESIKDILQDLDQALEKSQKK